MPEKLKVEESLLSRGQGVMTQDEDGNAGGDLCHTYRGERVTEKEFIRRTLAEEDEEPEPIERLPTNPYVPRGLFTPRD
jgi:hypothetical protein